MRLRATFFLPGFLLPVSALAAVHMVAPDGTGDFPTIQAAVDAAADGDEILLEDGTFTGPGNTAVDFSGKAITIRSQGGDPSACTIDCEDSGVGFLFSSGEDNLSVLADVTVTRSGIYQPTVSMLSSSPTLRNVAVVDAGTPAVYAEYGAPVMTGCRLEANTGAPSSAQGIQLLLAAATIEDCAFVSNRVSGCIRAQGGTTIVRRCTFDSNEINGILMTPGNGAPPGEPPVAVIEDCSFDGNYRAITASGSGGTSSLTVRGCEIRNHGGNGIDLSGVLVATVEDCEILTGSSVGLWATGGGVNLTMERCLLEGNASGLRLANSVTSAPTADIRDCAISGNQGQGIRSEGVITLEDSRLQGNGKYGVFFPGAASSTVRRCLITGNAAAGVRVVSSSSVTIEECTIASNHSGFSGGGVQVYGGGVQVTRSIVWGNCSDADGWEMWTTNGGSVQVTCTVVDSDLLGVFGSGTYVTQDLVEQDPLLCSPEACPSAPTTGGIYGLAPGSPALTQLCGVIGAPQPSCTAVGVGATLSEASWGRVKAGYRH